MDQDHVSARTFLTRESACFVLNIQNLSMWEAPISKGRNQEKNDCVVGWVFFEPRLLWLLYTVCNVKAIITNVLLY